jgi:hypothetical protein
MLKALLRHLAGLFAARAIPELARNEPCHCGSGRKYKRCCLQKDSERLRSERLAAAAGAGNYVGGRGTIANSALGRANEYRPPKGK